MIKSAVKSVLNRGRIRLTTVFMAAVLVCMASVPSFARDYHWNSVVYALDTDVYHLTFVGNEWEILQVRGDGNTDIDLYVYDENGRLVAKDDDGSAYCIVRFVPRWTGPFTIHVVNRGRVSSAYAMSTN